MLGLKLNNVIKSGHYKPAEHQSMSALISLQFYGIMTYRHGSRNIEANWAIFLWFVIAMISNEQIANLERAWNGLPCSE